MIDFSYITDQQGILESRINYSGIFSLFKNGSNLTAFYIQNYERLTEEFEISDDIIIPEVIYILSIMKKLISKNLISALKIVQFYLNLHICSASNFIFSYSLLVVHRRFLLRLFKIITLPVRIKNTPIIA
jgi:hypothetical protein